VTNGNNDIDQNGSQHTSIDCHYAECHYADCHDYLNVVLSAVMLIVIMLSSSYAEYCYAECHYTECHDFLNVVLSVVMFIVIMLSVVMLNVIMLNMLNSVCHGAL
jgi:hypothetical protein